MSDKHYVGLDIMEFENTGKHKPISRVTLFVDDEQSYTAGDDTGKEVSAFCPSATQAMADALLAQLRGYEYQSYSAGDANIDPAAELGDGVTVGGIYSVISQIDDDGSGYAGIAAPGEAELEEEYPYVGPLEREFNRKMHTAYSLIEKNNQRITLEVGQLKTYTDGALGELEKAFGTSLGTLEGNITAELKKYSTIEMTSSSISSAVSESKTYTDTKTGAVVAQLSNYSTIQQTANSISSAVSESKSYTDTKTGAVSAQLSNYSTITQTANSITAAVTESKAYTDGRYQTLSSTITQTATDLTAQINGVDGKYSTVKQTVDGLSVETVNGKTIIDGGNIKTSNLVLTGVITFEDLTPSLQNQVNATGISAEYAKTLITSTLVSSPNIAGGKFWNLGQTTWIEVGKGVNQILDDNYAMAIFANDWGGDTVFSIYRGDRGYTTLQGPDGFNFMTIDSNWDTVKAYGTWDFSAAVVTGVPAVFG